jgi:hypothetical protein
LNVRKYGENDSVTMSVSDFKVLIKKEIDSLGLIDESK